MNQLFFGDNLDILRQHIADETVDLISTAPPDPGESIRQPDAASWQNGRMTKPDSKGHPLDWIDSLPPEKRKLLDMLTPVELAALRRDGEEARKFAIAEFGLEDDEETKPR